MDRLFALVIALLLSLPTHAETIPASHGEAWRCVTYNNDLLSSGQQSREAACSAAAEFIGPGHYGTFVSQWYGDCEVRRSSDDYLAGSCFTQQYTGYYCPSGQGWTLSGSSCTRPDCEAGEIRQPDGSCVNECTALAGTTASSGYYNWGPPGSKPLAFGCVAQGSGGGCFARFTGTYPVKSTLVNGVLNVYAQGSYVYEPGSGMPCTPGTDPAATSAVESVPADTCGANQGYASMNGKTVCIDNATGNPTPESQMQAAQSTTQWTTTTDGQGTTTETIIKTHISGEQTITVRVTGPDGDVTETTTGPQEQTVIYGTLDDEAPTEDTQTVAISPGADWGGVGECPAPYNFTMFGHTIPFKFDGACQFFTLIRPVVLAAAWFAATLLLVGGVRSS